MTNANDLAYPSDYMQQNAENIESMNFCKGLSKREYFAAIALQGLLTKYTLNKPEDQQIICKMAVELSNELINALNETA